MSVFQDGKIQSLERDIAKLQRELNNYRAGSPAENGGNDVTGASNPSSPTHSIGAMDAWGSTEKYLKSKVRFIARRDLLTVLVLCGYIHMYMYEYMYTYMYMILTLT